MPFRSVLAALIVAASVVVAAGAARAAPWAEEIGREAVALLDNLRCLSRGSPADTVHIFAVIPDRSLMPEIDEMTAELTLNRVLSASPRMRVTRGGALSYVAVAEANSEAGRRRMADLLASVTNAAVSIVLRPFGRIGSAARTEVVLIARSFEHGALVVTCTPSFFVDIPLASAAAAPVAWPPVQQPPVHRPSAEDEIASFVRRFHQDASGPAEGLRPYYAEHVQLGGEWKSRDEIMRVRRSVARLDPVIELDEASVRIVPLGQERWEVSYRNTSWVTQKGRRTSTRWAVRSVVERRGADFVFIEIDPQRL